MSMKVLIIALISVLTTHGQQITSQYTIFSQCFTDHKTLPFNKRSYHEYAGPAAISVKKTRLVVIIPGRDKGRATLSIQATRVACTNES